MERRHPCLHYGPGTSMSAAHHSLTARKAAGDFSTIDDHRMFCYIWGFVGSQEGKERGDFTRCGMRRSGNVCIPCSLHFRSVLSLPHRGPDVPRTDGDHADEGLLTGRKKGWRTKHLGRFARKHGGSGPSFLLLCKSEYYLVFYPRLY